MRSARLGTISLRQCVIAGVIAILGSLGGCSKSGSGTRPPTSDRFAGADRPEEVYYEFVEESGGTKPKRGAKILLAFAPGGVAFIYATQAESQLAHHGNWSYSSGQMTLKFASSDLSVDARFPLDLNRDAVTLPFQVFAGKPGTLQWKARALSAIHGIYAAYLAASFDEESPSGWNEAVKRAMEYATGRAALGRTRTAHARAAQPGVLDSLIPPALAQSPTSCDDEEPSAAYQVAPDSLLLAYPCGASVIVLMPPVVPPNNLPALMQAPLSGDPRVFLDPFPPGNAEFDPPKSVMLFAPFMLEDKETSSWHWQKSAIQPVTKWSEFEGGAAQIAPKPNDFSLLPALRAHGYGNQILLVNEAASVIGLVKALTQNPTPGILMIRTHGAPNGGIASSDHWDLQTPPGGRMPSVWPGFWTYLKQLRAAGLGDLVDYDRPAGSTASWFTETLMVNTLAVGTDPTEVYVFAGVKPKFWQWLRETRRVDFHRSLVYVGACDTDSPPDPGAKFPAQAPYLRDAIQARAYFAWRGEVYGGIVDGALRYMLAQLTHPTHSAEEAFNNLQRVGARRNMIYMEDVMLDGKVGGPGSDAGQLNGYGWDGTQLVSYRSAGWLGTETARAQANAPAASGPSHFNGGQVWWILFAARWSQNSSDGETKILDCYHQIWSTGTMGALKSPQCNAYNGGQLPTADEVGYAMYLLRGQPNPSFSGQLVPRWTLDDGASR